MWIGSEKQLAALEKGRKKRWTLEMREKVRQHFLGRKLTLKQKEVAIKNLQPGYWLGKKRKHMVGNKNWAWKGGVTPINQKIRKTFEYEEWRKSVFERDYYTCQFCGQTGGKLNADHIKPFSLFPDLRLEISNGRTLCENCHKKTDTYGKKALNYRRMG